MQFNSISKSLHYCRVQQNKTWSVQSSFDFQSFWRQICWCNIFHKMTDEVLHFKSHFPVLISWLTLCWFEGAFNLFVCILNDNICVSSHLSRGIFWTNIVSCGHSKEYHLPLVAKRGKPKKCLMVQWATRFTCAPFWAVSRTVYEFMIQILYNKWISLKIDNTRSQCCTSAVVTCANLWRDLMIGIIFKAKIIFISFNSELIHLMWNGYMV